MQLKEAIAKSSLRSARRYEKDALVLFGDGRCLRIVETKKGPLFEVIEPCPYLDRTDWIPNEDDAKLDHDGKMN